MSDPAKESHAVCIHANNRIQDQKLVDELVVVFEELFDQLDRFESECDNGRLPDHVKQALEPYKRWKPVSWRVSTLRARLFDWELENFVQIFFLPRLLSILGTHPDPFERVFSWQRKRCMTHKLLGLINSLLNEHQRKKKTGHSSLLTHTEIHDILRKHWPSCKVPGKFHPDNVANTLVANDPSGTCNECDGVTGSAPVVGMPQGSVLHLHSQASLAGSAVFHTPSSRAGHDAAPSFLTDKKLHTSELSYNNVESLLTQPAADVASPPTTTLTASPQFTILQRTSYPNVIVPKGSEGKNSVVDDSASSQVFHPPSLTRSNARSADLRASPNSRASSFVNGTSVGSGPSASDRGCAQSAETQPDNPSVVYRTNIFGHVERQYKTGIEHDFSAVLEPDTPTIDPRRTVCSAAPPSTPPEWADPWDSGSVMD